MDVTLPFYREVLAVNDQVREFTRLFNEERDFYECHELFELAWKAESQEPLKSFYKALVQVATAQFKINQGYLRGFRKLYGYCFPALEALPDVYQGLDIARLRREFTAQLEQLPDADTIEPGSYPQYGLGYLTLGVQES
jgi:predicted metal-dependent hydrolase